MLPKREANYVPLTPTTFLKRAGAFYSNRTSLIYEGTRFTWRQTYDRCCRLASSLMSLGISKHDVVSVLAPNIPAMYEMHFAVPMAGAVLNTINTRLDAKHIANILTHSSAKLFFVDYEFVPLARDALRILFMNCYNNSGSPTNLPLVIVIDDVNAPTGVDFGETEYEHLIHKGNPSFVGIELCDEWDPISLNYTSGTTSEPKGVVYSHRGAYLSTLSVIMGWEMGREPVYLWTLPMFHCNGWALTWGVAACGGTNVCLRNTTAYDIYHNIKQHNVTHMCGAPIIFNILLETKPSERSGRIGAKSTPIQMLTGGAPPPAALVEKIEPLGFKVTHGYGMTEATGTALMCEWQTQWNKLPKEEQSKLKARQGINILTLSDMDVKVDSETMESVPHDGKTMGEIVLRGSSIMKGYFKDTTANDKAFRNGWFWTGDVGVIHPDGYVEIKDRSKDVIISGGENISSVELESVLYRHPHILEAAVVAMPHPKWGESPCAFVALREDAKLIKVVTETDIIAYCRENLPHFMVPKKVEFVHELPKTSTGKIKKFQLRARAKAFTFVGSSSDNKPVTRAHCNEQNFALCRL